MENNTFFYKEVLIQINEQIYKFVGYRILIQLLRKHDWNNSGNYSAGVNFNNSEKQWDYCYSLFGVYFLHCICLWFVWFIWIFFSTKTNYQRQLEYHRVPTDSSRISAGRTGVKLNWNSCQLDKCLLWYKWCVICDNIVDLNVLFYL